MNHELDLHQTATALEHIGQNSTANAQRGRSLFDPRHRTPTDDPVARVSAAIIAVNPNHPVLASPHLDAAVHLIRGHFAAVAASDDFCTRITWRDTARTRGTLRVEHCASGMWLYADLSGPITDRIVNGPQVNLDPGQSQQSDHACPPYPAHLHQPEWTAWTRGACFGAPGDAVLGAAINRRYLGLGIGRRLYARGAAIVPNARWAETNAMTEESKGIRRAMHRGNPWRWQNRACPLCGQSGQVDWRQASRAELAALHDR